MKKIISLVALGLIVLTSCKKDYSCECKTTGGSAPLIVSTTINDTKKKATDACESKSVTASGIVTTCTIK